MSSLLFTVCNKGDGEHFYLEEGNIYHSSLKCSEIKSGIRPDEYDMSYFTICPKCMDDDLIGKLKDKRKDKLEDVDVVVADTFAVY